MAKIDLDSLSIDELATLRDRIIEKLAEKVVARQAELEAEIERLSQYGKASKNHRRRLRSQSRRSATRRRATR